MSARRRRRTSSSTALARRDETPLEVDAELVDGEQGPKHVHVRAMRVEAKGDGAKIGAFFGAFAGAAIGSALRPSELPTDKRIERALLELEKALASMPLYWPGRSNLERAIALLKGTAK